MFLTAEEWSALRLSAQVAVLAVAVSLPFAIALAYGLARWNVRGKWVVDTLVNLPLVLPPVVTGYFLLLLFGQRGLIGSFLAETMNVRITFTWFGAALASAVVSFPLMVRAIRLSFENVESRLESAAKTLGAGPIDTFFTISLPLAYRGVIAGSVLAFARSLGEFGATLMVAGNIPGQTRTIPLAIYSFTQRPGGLEQSWRLVVVSVLLACAALVLSEWMEQRRRRNHA